MLVREHDQLVGLLPRPRHDRRGICRRADDAAVLAAESFDVGGRIDVGHGHDPSAPFFTLLDVDAHFLQFAPADVELIAGGHVRHGASRREVWQHDLLVRRAHDIGAFGHEMNAAEDDELGLAATGRRARELQRIAGEVGELDDLVALVVMPEDDQPFAKGLLRSGDARVHLVVREAEIALRERLALADALLLDLSEEFYVHLRQSPVFSRQSAVLSRQSQSVVSVGSLSRQSQSAVANPEPRAPYRATELPSYRPPSPKATAVRRSASRAGGSYRATDAPTSSGASGPVMTLYSVSRSTGSRPAARMRRRIADVVIASGVRAPAMW